MEGLEAIDLVEPPAFLPSYAKHIVSFNSLINCLGYLQAKGFVGLKNKKYYVTWEGSRHVLWLFDWMISVKSTYRRIEEELTKTKRINSLLQEIELAREKMQFELSCLEALDQYVEYLKNQ